MTRRRGGQGRGGHRQGLPEGRKRGDVEQEPDPPVDAPLPLGVQGGARHVVPQWAEDLLHGAPQPGGARRDTRPSTLLLVKPQREGAWLQHPQTAAEDQEPAPLHVGTPTRGCRHWSVWAPRSPSPPGWAGQQPAKRRRWTDCGARTGEGCSQLLPTGQPPLPHPTPGRPPDNSSVEERLQAPEGEDEDLQQPGKRSRQAPLIPSTVFDRA